MWTIQSIQGTGAMLPLAAVGIEIPMAELYVGMTPSNDTGGVER